MHHGNGRKTKKNTKTIINFTELENILQAENVNGIPLSGGWIRSL